MPVGGMAEWFGGASPAPVRPHPTPLTGRRRCECLPATVGSCPAGPGVPGRQRKVRDGVGGPGTLSPQERTANEKCSQKGSLYASRDR